MKYEAGCRIVTQNQLYETLENMSRHGWKLVTVVANGPLRELYFQRKAKLVPLLTVDGLLMREGAEAVN